MIFRFWNVSVFVWYETFLNALQLYPLRPKYIMANDTCEPTNNEFLEYISVQTTCNKWYKRTVLEPHIYIVCAYSNLIFFLFLCSNDHNFLDNKPDLVDFYYWSLQNKIILMLIIFVWKLWCLYIFYQFKRK